MQPIKDKSLHYFVIEDEGFSKRFYSYSERSYSLIKDLYDDNSFSSVVHLLKFFKDNELDDLFIKFAPKDPLPKHYNFMEEVDGKVEMKRGYMQGEQAVKIPVKIKFIEEVKHLQPYAGSVDFTIGSSKRRKENDRVLVGVEFNLEDANEQVERFNENNRGIEMKLDEMIVVNAIFQKQYYNPLGDMSKFSRGGFVLDIPLLGHDIFKYKEVKDYTYDELYKYYTLL